MHYVRVCEGLNNVGKLIPVEESFDKIFNHIKNPEKQDYYKSIFYYSEDQKVIAEQKIQVEKNGKKYTRDRGVSDITDVTTNKLVFDFDNEDTELARKDTIDLCTRLISKGLDRDNLQICFSGNKGFSVEIITDKLMNPEEFKNIVFSLAEGLKTFDPKIHNPSRVFRIPLTKHQVSGLYKLPLSFDQLVELPSDFIKELASDSSNVDDDVYKGWHEIQLPDGIYKLKESKETKTVTSVTTELDMSVKPRWLTPAKFALQEGYFGEGNRNTAFMILAATYRNQGFNKDIVYRMLKGVAERQAARNGAERYPDTALWNEVIETVFGQNWKGGQYSKDHEFLVETAKSLGLDVNDEKETNYLVTVDSVSDIFKKFAVDIDKNTMKLGIERIDKEITVTTSMLVGMLAAPSAGKTSISLNVLNDASNRDISSVFFSLDMGAPLIFQRLIQKHEGMGSKEIFNLYKNGSPRIADIEENMRQQYKNVNFCFKSGITTDDMKNYIIKKQDDTGNKIKLVVCDYLECIQGPYSDQTANTSIIAQKLKDIANELELTLVLLLQPQKHAGDPSSELLSYRNIKGSSAIEQAASIVFTMWRPGFSPKQPHEDRYMTIAAVKNRMGGLNTFDFRWEGVRGIIGEMDDAERAELKELRDRRKREKEQEDGGF